MDIVLIEPEIPQNTGNIARTCAAAGAGLHLVRPLGFSVEDRYLKRAGLDYWDKLNIYYWDSFEDMRRRFAGRNFYFSTTKAVKIYTEVFYEEDCLIVFGKETQGLPEALLRENFGNCIRIPMLDGIRSLNLSNAVAVIMYEAMRQAGFEGMKKKGRFSLAIDVSEGGKDFEHHSEPQENGG